MAYNEILSLKGRKLTAFEKQKSKELEQSSHS